MSAPQRERRVVAGAKGAASKGEISSAGLEAAGSPNPKEAVKLRLDHDVLAACRKTGSGWQTRINADLRKAARKLAG
jgi:uncharacterized protein (DUF4415 family)